MSNILERPRRVVCAAIRAFDGEVLIGIRHYSEDMAAQMRVRRNGQKFHHRYGDDQGFVDNNGEYMTRQEAWKVAEAAGQIIRRVGGDTSDGGTLYSENLY